jgi:hypothetical protein
MIYAVGAQWTRTFESKLSLGEIRGLLCSEYGCIAGVLSEPFGDRRGQMLVQRGHMLVLVLSVAPGETTVVVVPAQEMQNLLWSFSNGYAAQWSDHELRGLTGRSQWNAVIELASSQFVDLVQDVSRSVAGQRKPVEPTFDEGAMELPSDYLHSSSAPEDASCAP